MANQIRLKRASGSDPSASDLATGELAIRTSNCKLFSKNDSGSAIGIVAGSADTLTTARTIAGVSFDGSANISLNNNAITNGAGYLADIVSDTSPQLGGNLDLQSNKITTATSNGNVKIEPNGTGVVEVRGAGGNDGKLQLNCSAQSHGIKLASPAHSAGQSYTLIFPDNQIAADKYLKIKSISGSGSTAIGQAEYASLDANDLGEGTVPDARFPSTLPALNGSALTDLNGSNIASGTIAAARIATLNQNTTGSAATLTTARNIGGVSFDGSANINLPGVNTSGNQDTSGNAATATKLATARTIAGVSFDGSANISLNNNAITNGAGYLTSVGTSDIDNDAVTFAKLENVAQDRILGRNNSGTGDCEELTASEVRTLLNVADGATNVTNNNQLTNGAGYITSADGGNAATLDSIDSSQFLRSDTADSASGILSLSAGIDFGADARCAAALSSLSDGSTITVDFNSGIHHTVTLGGNRTFGDPSNTTTCVGQSGSIFIVQDGTGSRTASFHSDYKFIGGTAPTLSTSANAVDRLDYVIRASDNVHCVLSLDVK